MAGRKPWTNIASVTKQNPAPIARDLIDLMARRRPSRRPSCERALQEGVHHRSEEHTSELQSPCNLVCRLLLEKKKKNNKALRSPLQKIDRRYTCTTRD